MGREDIASFELKIPDPSLSAEVCVFVLFFVRGVQTCNFTGSHVCNLLYKKKTKSWLVEIRDYDFYTEDQNKKMGLKIFCGFDFSHKDIFKHGSTPSMAVLYEILNRLSFL
jgi:hypothetical protein